MVVEIEGDGGQDLQTDFGSGIWVGKGERGRGDVSKMRIGGPTNWVSSK